MSGIEPFASLCIFCTPCKISIKHLSSNSSVNDLPPPFLFTFLSYSMPLLLPSAQVCPCCCPRLQFVHANRHALVSCNNRACHASEKKRRREVILCHKGKKETRNSLPFQVHEYTKVSSLVGTQGHTLVRHQGLGKILVRVVD